MSESETKRSIAGRPANEVLQREIVNALSSDQIATVDALRGEIARAKELGLEVVELSDGRTFNPRELEDALYFVMDPTNHRDSEQVARNVARGLGDKFKSTVPFGQTSQAEKPLREKVADAFGKAFRAVEDRK